MILAGAFYIVPVSANSFCVTDRCKKAAQDAITAQEKSNLAAQSAKTLEGTIAALSAQIAALNAQIVAGEIKANDLKNQITLAKSKLSTQQKALAQMLVDMHFSKTDDTVEILANSSSLSDFTEKQARADLAQAQIASTAEEIRIEKERLEEQKKEVERILADQQNSRNIIAAREAEQQRLKVKYQHDASSFAADAEAARKIKAEEIAKEIARLNSIGSIGQGINTYPYRNVCPGANLSWSDQWGFVCQCVHYTGYKVKERWGVNVSFWGNANTWDNYAGARGFLVDRNPTPMTVAVNKAGAYGHVMWVESVNPNGTINVSEYNNAYSSKSGRWGDYGYRSNVSPQGLVFIHFNK